MRARLPRGPPKLRRIISFCPHTFGDDFGCEGFHAKKEDGETSKHARKGTLVVRLVESKNSGEVRNRDKIFKEHIH